VAGIPFGKYERSDWRRVPGAQRRYALVSDPSVTISRRQFDEHYGAAVPYGTYEKKTKLKSKEREALLRPARGRTSALKLSPAEKEAELGRRRVAAKEAATEKKVARGRAKQYRYPTKIDLRNFPKGRIYRTFELPVSYDAIVTVREAAERSRIVFGYYVGANLIDRDGELRSIAQFSLRDIKMKYTELDFEKLMKKVQEKDYAQLISLWIHLKLKEEIAIKRNGWKKRR
jgi:hypothetical protein